MKLTGNTVLVTGGGSGIGLAFAEKFLELGNRVIICGRSSKKLELAARQHPCLATLCCDLTDAGQVMALVEKIKDEFVDLNILVNNTGIQFLHQDRQDKNSVRLAPMASIPGRVDNSQRLA